MNKSKTIHMIESNSDEQYELFQSIIQNAEKRITMLEPMTREERIEYFRSRLYPQDINFDLDCGATVLHVNSKFAKNSEESIAGKVQRVSQKINT
jgi:hypothetical protein